MNALNQSEHGYFEVLEVDGLYLGEDVCIGQGSSDQSEDSIS